VRRLKKETTSIFECRKEEEGREGKESTWGRFLILFIIGGVE